MPEIAFDDGLTVTDDGDGTVTVETDTTATLAVSQFDVGERGAGESFAVDVTVAETSINSTDNYRLTTEDVTVALAVMDPGGNTVYDQQLTTDVPSGGTLVTFGVDGSTDEVGPLNTGEHTATVTAEMSNGGPASAIDAFDAAGHASAPDDLGAVLDGMDQDDGTYVVTNDHELQAMAADLSADYCLGSDIVASYTGQWYGDKGFDPVGPFNNAFTGTFDGNGHTITGLTIDRSSNFVGLFETTDAGATLTDIGLDSADINGNDEVGALVGENNGVVEQSYATGTVSGAHTLGGLAGDDSGTVTDSYWDTESTDQDASDGSAAGLTTAEMTGVTPAPEGDDTMSAFDFTDLGNGQRRRCRRLGGRLRRPAGARPRGATGGTVRALPDATLDSRGE